MASEKVIFETIAGSWLYGMGHDNSDVDMFRVVDSHRTKARHTLGITDTVDMPFNVFLKRIREGSHQSIEALFSPQKVWNPDYDYYRPMLDSYRVGGPEVFAA